MTRAPGSLVGRSAELAMVRELLDLARVGTGATGCFEGVAGIGKTALIRAAEQTGRDQGFAVLTARASLMECSFAFGVVRQLFEPLLAGVRAAERQARLSGAAEITASLWGRAEQDHADAGSADAAQAFLHGLYWLTANVAAERPLLVAVDDLQWVDLPSLRWLAYLLRRIEGLPVLVLTTHNVGEAPTSVQLLADVIEPARRFLVGGLDEQNVRVLAEEVFRGPVDEQFAAACRAATGGNPLLLHEVLRVLAAEGVEPRAGAEAAIPRFGPQALARHVKTRLERHPAAVIELARSVAVLEESSLDTAAAMAGLPLPVAADAARALATAGLLTRGPKLTFVHGLVRAAVVHELSAVELEAAHAWAAELLHRAGARAERVAAHLLAAPPTDDGWAIGLLRKAASVAQAKGAYESSVAYLRRALAEPLRDQDRYQIVGELGLAELQVDLTAALEHVGEAIEHIDKVTTVARLAGGLAWSLYENDRCPDAVDILERAIKRIEPHDPELARELEVYLVTNGLLHQSTVDAVLPRLPALRAHRFVRPESGRRLALVLALQHAWIGKGADVVEATVLDALAADVAREVDESVTPPVATAQCLMELDRPRLAYQVCDDTMAEARRHGQQYSYATMCAFRGQAAYRLGRLLDARDDSRAALELFDELGTGRHKGSGLMTIAKQVEALIDLGELEAARALLSECGLLGELPAWALHAVVPYARGRMWAALGDLRAGLTDQLSCGRLLNSWGVRNPGFVPWRSHAARAYAALGNTEDANALATEELSLARRWGKPRGIGVALHTMGVLAAGEERVGLLTEATGALATVDAPLDHARALVELGIAEHSTGRKPDARRHLREALDLTEACGAAPMITRVREELRRIGVRPPPPRRGTDTGLLTAHEYRIATMAAEGQTNREIAQAFFVTQRAIELHLTSVYRKLGISRRAQLAVALADAAVPNGRSATMP